MASAAAFSNPGIWTLETHAALAAGCAVGGILNENVGLEKEVPYWGTGPGAEWG
jgi:hypothetical protein